MSDNTRSQARLLAAYGWTMYSRVSESTQNEGEADKAADLSSFATSVKSSLPQPQSDASPLSCHGCLPTASPTWRCPSPATKHGVRPTREVPKTLTVWLGSSRVVDVLRWYCRVVWQPYATLKLCIAPPPRDVHLRCCVATGSNL
ncbi:hypothetical protein CGCSCA5_v009961 [Colletotrichum siamense]|nr:hypothetical protein CGCSCA5_v009961 [Colletotrichum siamense]